MDILNSINVFIDNLIHNLGIYGPILGCLFILVESILPFLPLFVFITLNFLSFGFIIGFIVSWLFTVLGCVLAFILVRKFLYNWFQKRMIKYRLVGGLMHRINKLKFQEIVLIVAIPFTPAFAINIAAGLSEMKLKKFFLAMFIGKIFMVYFWGFIGTSLIQSLTHPENLIKVVIASIIAYVCSIFVNKKFNLD